jgi:hypothetical protein
MKRLLTIIVAVLLTATLWAQSPLKMSYQAVIRNSSDQLVINHAVGMRITILQGSASGAIVYTETQTPVTNANGLVSIEIGGLAGFDAVNWANYTYFIKTETDPTGGTGYTITGTSQLLSVPYALHAKTVASYPETDPIFGAWNKSTGISITASQVGNFQSSVTNNPEVLANTAKNSYPSADQSKLAAITGTNTGDETIVSIKSKLGITTLSGINTGDQDIAAMAHTNRTDLDAVSGTNTGDQDLSGKVDKVTGKELSANDYTTAEQTKLAGISAGAEVNVNADWNSATGDAQILNKPIIDGSETKLISGTSISVTGNGTTATPYIANVRKSSFYLGQDTLGGIVYYVYLDSYGNQHGLIVSKTESTGQWQSANSITNANRSWDGAYNTALMTNSPAATYVTGLGAGWYLPSIDELSLLLHSRFHVNKAMNSGGFTLISKTGGYWSSTESAENGAWFLYFVYYDGGYTYKTNSYSVRAVRAF